MNAVAFESVSKSFGTHLAVDQLSLEIPQGAIYGFIGPNGSGKTTTLRMILHILYPDRGKIEVLGQTARRAANDRIGYLPEERGLYRKMSVCQVVSYYAQLKGVKATAARHATDAWLERFGIAAWSDKKVETLSKGMQQKVQFIATVVSKPELIILDEPFSGLDPVNLEVLRETILELRQEGATVIFSTHDMAKAEQMCDSICMIFQGRKVLDGSLNQIQAESGADIVRLKLEEESGVLDGYRGIESIRDFGQIQEVRIAGDPQTFLHYLCTKAKVQHFEVVRPSLHDIFIHIAI